MEIKKDKTLEIIKQMKFKEKQELVREYCMFYKKIQILKNKNLCDDMKIEKDLSIFKSIINVMSFDEKTILEKEYLSKTDSKSNWYLDYWCKTKYYDLKHSVVNNFLYYVYS